jgi:diguanylate cyclase (GGDEF)-like protein
MAEQRILERLPLTMNVLLIARGMSRRSCRMRDICSGGALLELRDNVGSGGGSGTGTGSGDRQLGRGDVVLIRMFLGEGQDVREHELRARIAHVDSGLFGVSFFSPDDATLNTLLAAAQAKRETPTTMTAEGKTLIERLGLQMLSYCREAFGPFARLGSERLLQAAENARSNSDQRTFFEAATLLRQQHETLRARYLQYLKESFAQLDQPEKKSRDVSGLALVDKDQFEEWLVVKVMATRVDENCRAQLFGLQARLDELGHVGYGRQHNLFSPAHICESFQKAILLLHPVMAVEKVLYGVFEETLLANLESAYITLNDTLIKNNVLPTLDLSRYITHNESDSDSDSEPGSDTKETKVGAEGAKASATSRSGNFSQAASGSAGFSSSVAAVTAASAISNGNNHSGTVSTGRKIEAVKTVTGKMPPPRSAAEFLSRTEQSQGLARERFVASQKDAQAAVSSLKRLFELQHDMRSADYMHVGIPEGSSMADAEFKAPPAYFELQDVQKSFSSLKSASGGWRQELEGMAEAQGTELAGTVLSVVQMAEGLLQTLAQNQLIGEHAKGWFNKLELPVLHSLMNDDDLFQRDDHPARQVLNRLARLGFKDHPLTREQAVSIDKIVDHIGQGFDNNPHVFQDALSVLDPFVVKQEQAYERNLERVRQMAEGEYKLDNAKARVQEVLDDRLAGKKVPQPILSLLDAGWHDLLVKICLRQGEDSRAWNDYAGLVDELLAIGADVHRAFDLREILRLIKTGLQEVVEITGRQQQQTVAELKHLLAGPQRLLGDVQWALVPAKKEEINPDEERWLQKWMERASRLQLGDWMELRHRGAEPERLRLAWRDNKANRFVFVNHQGVKVNDFTLRELAALMHTGNALIFEGSDVPIVDDALERVVHQLYEQLAWQASHDELTNLCNRAEFNRHLERALDAAKRQRARHVLAYINLDQFKIINNNYGLAAGDQLLKDLANLFNKALTPKLTVARLNADEFTLLLEDCDLGKAQQLVSMRLGELSAMKFSWENKTYKLTASAGLVDITYTSDTAARVLRAAEEACAQAKSGGGNRIQVYQPNDDEMTRRDNVMTWVAKLNQALEEESLTLRCQRIQATNPERAKEELPYYEILLGMKAEGGEDLPSSEFVQAAERYNRMLAVDRWVVDSTFHWLKLNSEKFARMGMVAINLSGHSLSDTQMMSYVMDRLLEYKLPTEKICFEITETTAISNLADAIDLMHELKKIGCKFTLDDFGAGHATYNYLKRLPLDFVKIDGSFVRDIDKDKNDYVMVRSINDLAHYMGIQTIAEYVEDDMIFQRLSEIGVDYVQGYGIERPRWLDSL